MRYECRARRMRSWWLGIGTTVGIVVPRVALAQMQDISAVALVAPAAMPSMATPLYTCGGPQYAWGVASPGPRIEGVGLITFDLDGDAFMELRDPLGRWIRFDRRSDEYRSEIPDVQAIRHYPMDSCSDDDSEDDAPMEADSTVAENNHDELELRGPLCGEYILQVIAKPGASWGLMLDAFGAGDLRTGWSTSSSSATDSLSRYRLRYDLADEVVIQVDTLRDEASVSVFPPRVSLRLPCEPDSFESMPAAVATVEVDGGQSRTFTVTMPDGETYDDGPGGCTGGLHVSCVHPKRFSGAPRGMYQFAVEAETTAMYRVKLTRELSRGRRVARTDSLMIHAGDARYWHASWSERGKRNSLWLLLDRGPVPVPPMTVVQATILAAGAEPALSRDGRRLAFVRGPDLWQMDVATGERARVGRFRNPHWPTWSPDGNRILFQAEHPDDQTGRFRIWTVRADGTALREAVPPGASQDQYPIWSPRGDRMVWTRGAQLWIADSSGMHARPLTQRPARVYERACEWSERDDLILYTASDGACDGPQYQLRVVRPDGSAQALKANVPAEDAKRIPGTAAICAVDGRRALIASDGGEVEPTALGLGSETAGFRRSRIAIASDGRTAVVDATPPPDGETVLVRFGLPVPVSRYYVRRWRDGLLLVGTDSTTVESVWGRPRKRSTLHSNGLRVWSYSLGDRGGPKDGWLQFYFTSNGKLWQVTRGPEPVWHALFRGIPRDGR